MTLNDIDTSIINRFAENYNLSDVQHENVPFDLNREAEFVRLSVVKGDSKQVSMGGASGNYFRQQGIIYVQVYTPVGLGTSLANTIAESVSGVWRNQQFDNIVCGAPDINHIGEVDGWFQLNVSCDFYVHSIY